jgi:hypothetical protein
MNTIAKALNSRSATYNLSQRQWKSVVKMSHSVKGNVAKPDYSGNEIDKLIDKIRKDYPALSQKEVNSKIKIQLKINWKEHSGIIRKVQRYSKSSFKITGQLKVKLEKSEEKIQELKNALKDAEINKEKVNHLTDAYEAVKNRTDEVKQENEKGSNKLKIINCQGRDKLWRKSKNLENAFETEKRHPSVIVPPLECKNCDEFAKCLEKQKKELDKKSKASL